MKRKAVEKAIEQLPDSDIEEEDDVQVVDVPSQMVAEFKPVSIEEKPVNIRPPVYEVREKGIKNLTSGILQTHFATLIVGRPDSGKSHLLYEYITNPDMYAHKFNRIIFITPLSKIGNLSLAGNPHCSQQFSLAWLQEQISVLSREIQERYPTKDSLEKKYGQRVDPINALIVLDDCIADLKKHQYDPFLKNLFFNRRHQIPYGCVSLLITTQYYVELPKSLRSNLTSLIVFNCTPKDWKNIQEETLHGASELSTEVTRIVKQIFSKPKQFVYINMENGQIYYGFQRKISQDTEEILQKKIKIE